MSTRLPNPPNVTHTTTLHRKDGKIAWCLIRRGEHFTYLDPAGRFPWDYIAEHDRDRVREYFSLVVHNQLHGPIRYTLDTHSLGGFGVWCCETSWHRVPCSPCEVIGISTTWSATVETLSKRERAVAKLLPTLTIKEIAAVLKLDSSTVRTIRHRISEKVDQLGPALVAWCQAHVEVL